MYAAMLAAMPAYNPAFRPAFSGRKRSVFSFEEAHGSIMSSNQYETLLKDIYERGAHKSDRTGTGTRSLFGCQMRFPLADGFPLVTTKKVTIWDEWADENGELGPVYGRQWRAWPASDGRTIDQISEVLERIKKNPDSRRLLVTAWNPAEVDKMALPPCHCLFQFYVADGRLSCQLYQRSCDMFLGVPFNIASYALLTHMVAQQCDLEPGDFVWTGGDCHIYDNHLEQTALQLSREPRPYPKLVIKRRPASLFEYEYEDFEFEGYDPWPGIKAPVAV